MTYLMQQVTVKLFECKLSINLTKCDSYSNSISRSSSLCLPLECTLCEQKARNTNKFLKKLKPNCKNN